MLMTVKYHVVRNKENFQKIKVWGRGPPTNEFPNDNMFSCFEKRKRHCQPDFSDFVCLLEYKWEEWQIGVKK